MPKISHVVILDAYTPPRIRFLCGVSTLLNQVWVSTTISFLSRLYVQQPDSFISVFFVVSVLLNPVWHSRRRDFVVKNSQEIDPPECLGKGQSWSELWIKFISGRKAGVGSDDVIKAHKETYLSERLTEAKPWSLWILWAVKWDNITDMSVDLACPVNLSLIVSYKWMDSLIQQIIAWAALNGNHYVDEPASACPKPWSDTIEVSGFSWRYNNALTQLWTLRSEWCKIRRAWYS